MPRIALADFLKESPKDHSPIAFFEVFRGEDKTSLKSIYVSLFNEAIKSRDPSIVCLGQEMKRRWNTDKIAVQEYWNENELEGIQEENISKAARRASKLDNAAGEYQLKRSLLKLGEGIASPPSTTPPGSPSRFVSIATTSETPSILRDILILADPIIPATPSSSGLSTSFMCTPTSSSNASASSSRAPAASTSFLINIPVPNAAKEGAASSTIHPDTGAALDLPRSAASDKASIAASKRKAGEDDTTNSSARGQKRSSTDGDALVDSDEVEDLISRIKFIKHQECDTWTVDSECVGCLVEKYQNEAIVALRRRELKKSEPADVMVLAGIFAPFNATPLMTQVFGALRLKEIKRLLVVDLDLDMPEFHESSVIRAIRLRMKDRVDQALDMLCAVTDRKLRNLFEQFLLNLPKVEDPPSAEETLVNNFVSPILRAFLQRTEDNIVAHFPNTESRTQKKQGVSPDRPDFKLCIGKQEIAFGEITGHHQKADKSKNGIDLWRLARFGKSVLDEGAPMVPLIQIIYEQGTVYRLVVRVRGIMVLAEVGVFTVPMHINAIGAFQASMPVLEWLRQAVSWLEDDREWGKRSWSTSDIAKIKKFLC